MWKEAAMEAPPKGQLPRVIELRGITQTYDGGKTFLFNKLNLLLEDKPGQGQFAVILGVSGCGKSTLLRYISGLQTPTSGEVLIDGKPKTDSMVISMVFQQYSSFPWLSVLDNVMLPLKFRGVPRGDGREQAMVMIKAVGLEGHEHKYAQSPILSGGQLQRVAIARSLISNPQIILMDEPFGALDTLTRFRMQTMLYDIWEKLESTIVFVTHDIQEAVFLGDDIYVMKSGRGTSEIARTIHVDLPLHRDRATKREAHFVQLVAEVEDAITSLNA